MQRRLSQSCIHLAELLMPHLKEDIHVLAWQHVVKQNHDLLCIMSPSFEWEDCFQPTPAQPDRQGGLSPGSRIPTTKCDAQQRQRSCSQADLICTSLPYAAKQQAACGALPEYISCQSRFCCTGSRLLSPLCILAALFRIK